MLHRQRRRGEAALVHHQGAPRCEMRRPADEPRAPRSEPRAPRARHASHPSTPARAARTHPAPSTSPRQGAPRRCVRDVQGRRRRMMRPGMCCVLRPACPGFHAACPVACGALRWPIPARSIGGTRIKRSRQGGRIPVLPRRRPTESSEDGARSSVPTEHFRLFVAAPGCSHDGATAHWPAPRTSKSH